MIYDLRFTIRKSVALILFSSFFILHSSFSWPAVLFNPTNGALIIPTNLNVNQFVSTNANLSVSNISAQTFNGGIFTGDGGGLTNLQSTKLVGANSLFQSLTNFLTRNCRFVDAGNGSDLNDGSANFPWATIAHAQTNVPTGWTMVIAPGSYADAVTNFQANYYLCSAANVTFDPTLGVSAPFTNQIAGDGNVNFTSIGDTLVESSSDIQICTIHAKNFQAGNITNLIEASSGAIYTVYCQTATLDIDGLDPASFLEIHADTANIFQLGAFDSPLKYQIFASTIFINRGEGGTPVFNFYTNSILSADTCLISTNTEIDSLSAPFIWTIGTTIGGNHLTFDSSPTFTGNPLFDAAPTFNVTPTGNYQLQ